MNSRASKNLTYLGMGKPQFASNPMLNELRSKASTLYARGKSSVSSLADSIKQPKAFDISGIYKSK